MKFRTTASLPNNEEFVLWIYINSVQWSTISYVSLSYAVILFLSHHSIPPGSAAYWFTQFCLLGPNILLKIEAQRENKKMENKTKAKYSMEEGETEQSFLEVRPQVSYLDEVPVP